MKLEKIQIKNFRSFRDETVNVDPYTCLVGPNGAGKSTVLCALNLFFREPASPTNVLTLCAEDFHHGNIGEPVEITLTFKDLSADAGGCQTLLGLSCVSSCNCRSCVDAGKSPSLADCEKSLRFDLSANQLGCQRGEN